MIDIKMAFFCQMVGFFVQIALPAYMALGIFRQDMRLSWRQTLKVLTGLLAGLDLIFCLLVVGWYTAGYNKLYVFANAVFSFCTVFFFLFFMYMVVADWRRKVFVFLFLLNYACLILWLSNLLIGLYPGYTKGMDGFPYSQWTDIHLFLVSAATIPVFYRFIYKKSFADLKNLPPRIWGMLIIMQLLYFLMEGFAITLGGFWEESQLRRLSMLTLLFLTEFVIYRVVFQMLQLYEEQRQMESRLLLQQQQYGHLKESINLVRRTKHDLEHHFVVIQKLSRKEETIQELKAYVDNYLFSIAGQETEYCDLHTVNALLNYYAQMARERGIVVRFLTDIPHNLRFEDIHMGVLFGNVLKNAVEGSTDCVREKKDAWIELRVRYYQHALILCAENTCTGNMPVKEGKNWKSTRHSDYGIGLSTIQNVAEQYRGTMELAVEKGVFTLKVVLYEP